MEVSDLEKEIEVLNQIKSEYLRSKEYYNRLAQRQCLEQYQLNKLIEVEQRIKAIEAAIGCMKVRVWEPREVKGLGGF